MIKWLRRLFCCVGWHSWGEPEEFRGATHIERCKYCSEKQLVIRTIMEGDFGTEIGDDNDLWDIKNKMPVKRHENSSN